MKRDLYYYLRTRKYLYKAWIVVRSSMAKSGSPHSRRDIHLYEEKVDRNLRHIQDRLRTRSYEFSQARGVVLSASKSPRPIVISSISDRIVQRSLLEVIQSDLTNIRAVVDHRKSFGGIKDRGVRHAIEATVNAIRNGSRYFIKSDIKKFFSNIPRAMAVTALCKHLPDNSLDDFLFSATTVELDNLGLLREQHQNLFPSYELGVAQGCCLSPLLGNILLRGFDELTNTEDVLCLRYIDDFLILGKNETEIREVFARGKNELCKFDLDTYDIDDGSKKAIAGCTQRSFSFLGCEISPGFVHPGKESRQNLLNKIKKLFTDSKKRFFTTPKKTEETYEYSLLCTLEQVHRVIAAWGNHYVFCNSQQLFNSLDQKIDEMLRNYLGSYASRRDRADQQERRRILGVHLLTDCNSKPII